MRRSLLLFLACAACGSGSGPVDVPAGPTDAGHDGDAAPVLHVSNVLRLGDDTVGGATFLDAAASVDDGLVVAGNTENPLDGAPARGWRDAIVARLDENARVVWLRQVGDAGLFTKAHGVAILPDGDVVIAGTINGRGRFEGHDLPASFTAFAARFAGDGTRRWLTLLGAADGTTEAMAVQALSNGVRVVGYTTAAIGGAALGEGDAFVATLDLHDGHVEHVARFGTNGEDAPFGLAPADAGTWLGVRQPTADLRGTRSFQLLRLADDGAVLGKIERTDVDPMTFTIAHDGTIVLASRTVDVDGKRLVVQQLDERGAVRSQWRSGPADVLNVNAVRCLAAACIVAGQVRGPWSGTDAIALGSDGFVARFGRELAVEPIHRFGTAHADDATAASTLAPAGDGLWLTGFATGPVLGTERLGTIDAIVARLSWR